MHWMLSDSPDSCVLDDGRVGPWLSRTPYRTSNVDWPSRTALPRERHRASLHRDNSATDMASHATDCRKPKSPPVRQSQLSENLGICSESRLTSCGRAIVIPKTAPFAEERSMATDEEVLLITGRG